MAQFRADYKKICKKCNKFKHKREFSARSNICKDCLNEMEN